MPSLHVKISLDQDVVLSASSATVGSHRTMQRIRGSVLLGACAAHNYDLTTAFALFHSNQVRFGDAYPVASNGPAYPMPFSLHEGKLGKGDDLWNLAKANRPEGIQLKQCREHFVSSHGHKITVPTKYTMRTAIDSGGQARGGLLFTIEAVAAGQSFISEVQADNKALLDEVRQRLVGHTHHLGRSRSAEFGKATVEEIDPPEAWPTDDDDTHSLVLWCISDLALRDKTIGSLRLEPRPEDFGIENAQLDPAKSFLRFGSWSPFNGHRHRPDLDRQVILAGSVLVFRCTTPVAPAAIRDHVAAGIGEYRNEGLGRIEVQPTLLTSDRLTLTLPKKSPALEGVQSSLPDDELGTWLKEQQAAEAAKHEAWTISRDWAAQMQPHKVQAAQWGRLRALAAAARWSGVDKESFVSMLESHFGLESDEAAVDKRNRKYGRGTTADRWARKHTGKTASERLRQLVSEAPEEQAIVATELLSNRMARLVRRSGRNG